MVLGVHPFSFGYSLLNGEPRNWGVFANHLINNRHWLFVISSSKIGLWWDHDLIIWSGFRNGSTYFFKAWLVSPFEVESGDRGTFLNAPLRMSRFVSPAAIVAEGF